VRLWRLHRHSGLQSGFRWMGLLVLRCLDSAVLTQHKNFRRPDRASQVRTPQAVMGTANWPVSGRPADPASVTNSCSTAGHGRSRLGNPERLASGHRVEPSAGTKRSGIGTDRRPRVAHPPHLRKPPSSTKCTAAPNTPPPTPAHHPDRQRRPPPARCTPSPRAPTANCCLPPWPSCWTPTTNDAPSVHEPGANTALKPGTRSRFRTIQCQQTPSCWHRT
jgi:hypothetical protein